MNKIFISLFFFFLLIMDVVQASENVFNYPMKSSIISKNIPAFKPVTCKFTQKKFFSNGRVLNSGGIFKITEDKNIIFETTFPVSTTSTFSEKQNKQIAKIINGISKNNYSYIDKNFNLYYKKNSPLWIFALKPKTSTNFSKQLSSLILKGNNKFINNININTINSGKTEIKYYDCE